MTEPAASDPKTIAVQKMYMAYPYPPVWPSGRMQRREDAKLFKKGQKMAAPLLGLDPGLATGRILDVGSGTGIRICGLASALPKATFTGLELSEASAEAARKNIERYGVKNLTMEVGDFFTEDIARDFDAVTCNGAIPTLHDPAAGMRRLVTAVRPGGLIYVAVYGSLGRDFVYRMQEAVSLLEPDILAFERRLALVRAFLGPKADHKFSNDAYTVDYFLHIQETQHRMDELFDVFESAGADVVFWPRFDKNLRKYVRDAKLRERVMALPLRERYRLVELLRTPQMLHVIARRRVD